MIVFCGTDFIDILLMAATGVTGVAIGLAIYSVRKRRQAEKPKEEPKAENKENHEKVE